MIFTISVLKGTADPSSSSSRLNPKRRIVKTIHPKNVSEVLYAISENDLSEISSSVIVSELLTTVMEKTDYELFGNRYLSMDLLVYLNYFYHYFEAVKDYYNDWKVLFEQVLTEITRTNPDRSPAKCYELASETCFMRVILPILDTPKEA